MKIPFWQRWRLFQKAAAGVLIFFFGIMAFVTVSAYLRKSGVTGMDMAQVRKLREISNR